MTSSTSSSILLTAGYPQNSQTISNCENSSEPQKKFDLLRSPFRSDDEMGCVLDFLDDKSVLALDRTSRIFRSSINEWCKVQCIKRGIIPESLPDGVNHKQFLLNRFPDALGKDTFQKYLGEADPVPIPKKLIEIAPNLRFKAVFIPEYITLELPENSPLLLDETTADEDGNMARLIEDSDRAPKEPRTLKVPVTANNVILLFEKYLKKIPDSNLEFGGLTENSFNPILAQNGNKGVGASRWSYQRMDLLGLSNPYQSEEDESLGQFEIAKKSGLEIVPLCERIIFGLLSYLKTESPPQTRHFERTSTTFHNNDENWNAQTTLLWAEYFGNCFRLDLHFASDRYDVGAAVEISQKRLKDD